MSNELADSIVKASQKMHKKELLQEMVPLYAISKSQCQFVKDASMMEHVTTDYMFKYYIFKDMDEVLEYATEQGYAPFKYYEDGILDPTYKEKIPITVKGKSLRSIKKLLKLRKNILKAKMLKYFWAIQYCMINLFHKYPILLSNHEIEQK